MAKTLTIVIAIVLIIALIAGISGRKKSGPKGHIEVTDLNDFYQAMFDTVEDSVLTDAEFKVLEKERSKKAKAEAKQEKLVAKRGKDGALANTKHRLFVIDFDGDIKASQVDSLKQTISAILRVATSQDEVLVKLESGGGMVHSYGLAASQLDRIKAKEIPLTVAVDKIAASGGYMMACVANRIIAAPFAIIGSIGVVAQMPNFNRLLKKHDVDFELLTAGEYKRTLTMFGENTDKGRSKFIEELELTHTLFKEYVVEHRQGLDIDAVATGEIWYGRQALEKKLVDEICTSDQYIMDQLAERRVVAVNYALKKNLVERISGAAETSFDRLVIRWLTRLMPNRPPV